MEPLRYRELCGKLGMRIQAIRNARGLRQSELACRAGLSVNYTGNIEQGSKNPSLKALYEVARALGVTVSDLFDFSDGDGGAAGRESEIVAWYRALDADGQLALWERARELAGADGTRD